MNNRTRRWVVFLAAAATVALTVRLGVWQLSRAAQKIALQASIEHQGALPFLSAEALARTPQEALGQVNRRVRLTGQWMPEHSVFLDNRQMNGRTGFYLLTPLSLPGGGAVLVERGWAPRDLRDRALLPSIPTSQDTVQIVGRIALAPSRLYEFVHGEAGVLRQNLELDAYALETGLTLRPVTVQQLEGATVEAGSKASQPSASDGLQRDWPRPAVDVQRNYGYAVQWFSLAALVTGLYVWFQLIQPWRRQRSDAED